MEMPPASDRDFLLSHNALRPQGPRDAHPLTVLNRGGPDLRNNSTSSVNPLKTK